MYTKESSQQTLKIPNNNLDVRFDKVIQNNAGMFTKESSQQTLKIPNNNLDVKFEIKIPEE